jgi:hypothetical protein
MEDDNVPSPDLALDQSPSPGHDSDLAVLSDLLQEHRVEKVVIRYYGSGDEGSVQDIKFHPEGVYVPKWAEDRLCDVAESYCPDGYENNDGGYGTLTLYPAEGTAEREHCDWYEDAEDMPVADARLPKRLHQQLQKLGVVEITARFDGSGDSGQIEEFEALPVDVEIPDALRERIEDLLGGLLPGGWEINEGSYGTFTVDVESGDITTEAAGRITSDSETDIVRWKWRD